MVPLSPSPFPPSLSLAPSQRVHSYAVFSYHSNAVDLTQCLETFTSNEVLDGDEKPVSLFNSVIL